jgi:AcrR family transcriptional regulator
MARPVNANAEETRQRILSAASLLFSTHGYEGASVRQIASGAGVSLGMIRHYFGSKEGLYRACLSSAFSIYGGVSTLIADGVAAGGSAAEVVAHAVRVGFRFACDNRPACRLVLWDMMQRERWRSELGDSEMLPFLLTTARALAKPLGRPAGELALVMRTLTFLVARYATADHDEVAYLLADGAAGVHATEETLRALEEHLVDVAVRLYT